MQLLFLCFLSPYLCIFVDESKVNKDNNFYTKLVSLMILTGFFTLLYANAIFSRTNKSVLYVSYSCIQLIAFGIFQVVKMLIIYFFIMIPLFYSFISFICC